MARPNLSYLKNLFLFFSGLPCGLLSGLTGIGAGVVTQPLVGYLLGLRALRLAATTVTVTFFAALSALLSYAQHGDAKWGLAVIFVAGQTVGALLSQRLLLRFPGLARLQWLWATLVVLPGLFMCADALGVGMLRGERSVALASLVPGLAWMTTGVLAVLVGVLSRLFGLGGALTVPAAIYGLGLAPQAAQGTAIVALLLASLPAILVHGARRELEPQSAFWMSLGAVFGGLLGAFYAVGPGMTAARLILIYGISLTLLGLSLLWRRSEEA